MVILRPNVILYLFTLALEISIAAAITTQIIVQYETEIITGLLSGIEMIMTPSHPEIHV